jgi:hypothetical protein
MLSSSQRGFYASAKEIIFPRAQRIVFISERSGLSVWSGYLEGVAGFIRR